MGSLCLLGGGAGVTLWGIISAGEQRWQLCTQSKERESKGLAKEKAKGAFWPPFSSTEMPSGCQGGSVRFRTAP